jgi:PLP dependent protein
MTITAEQFSRNLELIRARITAAGGDVNRVRVIAVSKGHPVEAVRAAFAAGHVDFGENYADELVEKATQFGTSATRPVWHFQGRLQTNKINRLKPFVSMWQTVDSVERARSLATRVPGAQVLVQLDARSTGSTAVPSGGSTSVDRSGAGIADVLRIVHVAKSAGLEVLGIMTVAPLAVQVRSNHALTQTEVTTDAFRRVAALSSELGLPIRSMGMTDDLELAIAAGSNMIRIGSALFGEKVRVT